MGIVLAGLGNYSTRELLPAIKESQHLKLVGVVTGSADKGVAWAREHGFPERNVWSYADMARMADAPEAELVYVVTPNSLHAEHSIAALRQGTPVPTPATLGRRDMVIIEGIYESARTGRRVTLRY